MLTIEKKDTNIQLSHLDQKYYLPTFKRYPLAIRRGKGVWVEDVEGNNYLDALAGIAVNNLGHCHPAIVSAIQTQVAKVMHISNFYVSEPQVKLSQMLVERSGMERVFFTNSGAESVEGAIKIARKYAHQNGRGGGVISMKNSFHGRTLATIATGKDKMQKGFGPMPAGFHRVPFNNIDAIKAILNNDIGAIILEPIQGEGGIHPVDICFLKELRNLCNSENIVLIFDEIQCGIGRTGKLFAKEHFNVEPDIMTLAKGLGSGMPVGAILAKEHIAQAIDFGDHGTTFGGNPLACAAGVATLETIEKENILEETTRKGERLVNALKLNIGHHPSFREIRGIGLMIGVEFDFEVKELVLELMNRKILANATAGNVLRLVPPLIISDEEIDFLVLNIKEVLHKIKGGKQ